MSKTFNLASKVGPGQHRLWNITHQPAKSKTPVRLELRERIVDKNNNHAPLSFTRVLGYTDTIADEDALEEAAKELLVRVGRVDQFVGVHEVAQ